MRPSKPELKSCQQRVPFQYPLGLMALNQSEGNLINFAKLSMTLRGIFLITSDTIVFGNMISMGNYITGVFTRFPSGE